jgi:hypothetical protein
LVVKEMITIFGVQRLILTNDMGCGQQWLVGQIFLTYITY